MPRRIASPCSYPLCRRVSGERFCAEHARTHAADDALARGTSASRGYYARHRRWRKLVIARSPICRMCANAPSTVADHIVPLNPRDPYSGDWSLANGQGLCRPCHNRKTATERAYG